MDCLEHLCHQLHLGARRDREHIAVKVDGAALVLGFGEYFSHSLQHTKTLVANNEFHSVQATAAEPLEEADPTGLVLFHALGGTKNLTVSVLIYRNRHQNGHIFKLSAPISAQADPIHIDIRIAPTLQRAVPPVLNVDIRFLIQLADGGRRHLASPQSLGNILYAPDRHACQVHLNEGFLHAALPAAIPLNDGGLEGDPFELGYLEGNIPGSGGKIAAVVAAAVSLALLITLVPGRLGQLLSLSLQQLVESFLYAPTHNFLEFCRFVNDVLQIKGSE